MQHAEGVVMWHLNGNENSARNQLARRYAKTKPSPGCYYRSRKEQNSPDETNPLIANKRPTIVTTAAGDPASSEWSSIKGKSVPITTRRDMTIAVPGPAPSCGATHSGGGWVDH